MSKNKNIVIGIIAVVLIAGGVYWFAQNKDGVSNTPTYGITNPPSPTPAPAPTSAPAPALNQTSAPTPASLLVTHNVTIQNFSFSPSSITLKKGDTAVWTNQDAVAHTVTGNNGGPSSPTLGVNGTYSFTFNSIGIFNYHCSFHPTMTGTVVVTQ